MLDTLIQFLLDHAEKFGIAGVFVAAIMIYILAKLWSLTKAQREDIVKKDDSLDKKEKQIAILENEKDELEKEFRKYIKESLPPGIVSSNVKRSAKTHEKILKELKDMHRDLHELRLVKDKDGSIRLIPSRELGHDPHNEEH